MGFNALFLSGQNKHQGKIESLGYHQRDFRYVLEQSGWTTYHKDVYSIVDVVAAYEEMPDGPLLVIYTGHGESQPNSKYPMICPVSEGFDLVKIQRGPEQDRTKNPTSYIFDCCNVESGIPLAAHDQAAATREFSTLCLNPASGYTLALRSGVYGYTLDQGTYMSHAMLSVLGNRDCASIEDFATYLNTLCLYQYKSHKLIASKKVKYVVTLNGSDPKSVGEDMVKTFTQSNAYCPEGILFQRELKTTAPTIPIAGVKALIARIGRSPPACPAFPLDKGE